MNISAAVVVFACKESVSVATSATVNLQFAVANLSDIPD